MLEIVSVLLVLLVLVVLLILVVLLVVLVVVLLIVVLVVVLLVSVVFHGENLSLNFLNTRFISIMPPLCRLILIDKNF